MLRFAAIIGLILSLAGTVSYAQEPGPLEGRLGGPLASWVAEYGEPLPPTSRLSTITFAADGTSTIIVDELDGVVTSAMVFAPRPDGEEWSYEGTHAQNWSLTSAQALAMEFLPRDVVLVDRELALIETADVYAQRCESAALLAQVPAAAYEYGDTTPTYGGCEVVLNLDSAGKIHSFTVELRIQDDLFD